MYDFSHTIDLTLERIGKCSQLISQTSKIIKKRNLYSARRVESVEKDLFDPNLALLEAEIKKFNEKSQGMNEIINNPDPNCDKKIEEKYNILLNKHKIITMEIKKLSVKFTNIKIDFKAIKKMINLSWSDFFKKNRENLQIILRQIHDHCPNLTDIKSAIVNISKSGPNENISEMESLRKQLKDSKEINEKTLKNYNLCQTMYDTLRSQYEELSKKYQELLLGS